MEIRSVFRKPDASITTALAVAGSVYAIYNLNCGPVSEAHASDPNHPVLETCRKKAACESFIMVSGLLLITRDANVGTLGYAGIIAMEASYRHAIMADPVTGKMQPPAPTSYAPAENVVPFAQQGQAVG